jgi:hypothetical protein
MLRVPVRNARYELGFWWNFAIFLSVHQQKCGHPGGAAASLPFLERSLGDARLQLKFFAGDVENHTLSSHFVVESLVAAMPHVMDEVWLKMDEDNGGEVHQRGRKCGLQQEQGVRACPFED